jgi:hypothetical protein
MDIGYGREEHLFRKQRTYSRFGRSTGDVVLSPRANFSGQTTSAPSIIPYEDLIDASGD